MDFSAANTSLWSFIVQLGIISAILLVSNFLRRKLPFVRKTLMPTAVIGGFLLLVLRLIGLDIVNTETLEMITYHGIALGFIALSLRVPGKDGGGSEPLTVVKSGAAIVSTYVIQGILGLGVSLALAYTFMPGMFKAAGILLPMAYGQGPGQANNIGTTFEALGFTGGRSFGLSLAAAGYLCACVVGVIYLNIIKRRGQLTRGAGRDTSDDATLSMFQDDNEIPISQSVDKLSIQMSLVLVVYFLSYLAIQGISAAVGVLGEGVANTVSSLLWGFNFMIGSIMAMLLRNLFKGLRHTRLMKRQYQNNYLLSRISGLAFDLMIVAGIALIDISDLKGLWIPFLLMAVSGGVVTLLYLQWICRRLYPGYYYEGLLSLYGNLTGTISSGILLLRELDPEYETPAANNLVSGSGAAIVFGAPMLALIGFAPEAPLIVLGLLLVYMALLVLFMLKVKGRKAAAKQAPESSEAPPPD